MVKKNKINIDRHLAFVALEVLRDNDGKMVLAELMNEVEKREGDKILNREHKLAGGRIAWEIRAQYKTIGFVKAGFLRKDKGVWYLSAEGEKALKQGEDGVTQIAKKAYREWKEKRGAQKILPDDAQSDDDTALPDDKSLVDIEHYQSTAKAGVQDYIRSIGEYEFQDVCAALLRGMDYHVRHVASPGPDGGIDIIAYTDPLGSKPPRIKVQVKHQQSKTSQSKLSELAGRLTDGDIGVFVSPSGFTAGCRDYARNNSRHLELIDLNRFVELWQQHYDKLSEEDKSLLPLQAIYFLDEKG